MGNAVLNRAVRPRANDEYLKNIFDIFAPDFEQVLTGLDYRAPELIRCLLEEIYGSKNHPGCVFWMPAAAPDSVAAS